jgi:hypothetical protein
VRRLLTVGCALSLSLLPVSSLQAFGIRHYHHRGVVATPGVAYYPTTGVSTMYYPTAGVSTISTFSPSFVQPSTLSFVPSTLSSYGCYGGMGGSSISLVPTTGLTFVPSSGFSTSSFGCFGGSGGPGPSSIQPSALNASVLVEALRLLKEVVGSRNGTSDDGTSGRVAVQIEQIKTRLTRIEANIEVLRKKVGLKLKQSKKGNLEESKATEGVFTPQAGLSSIGDEQEPDPFAAAVNAVKQARQAAKNARLAYEAAMEARDMQAAQVHYQASVLKALKKHLQDLGEKVGPEEIPIPR